MTRDDIIRMAREAGFNLEPGFLLRVTGIDEDLERFAALVAAEERKVLAQELLKLTRVGAASQYTQGRWDLASELEQVLKAREK